MLARLPLFVALLQIPWFIIFRSPACASKSSSSLPIVRVIDILIPLPAVAGVLFAAWLFFRGGVSSPDILIFLIGTVCCGLITAVFLFILLS